MNYLVSLLLVVSIGQLSHARATNFVNDSYKGRIVAWDTSFAIRMNPRDPEQHFIAEVLDGSGQNPTLIKLVYWVPTNGSRDGVHFIPVNGLTYTKRWIFRYHLPDPEQLGDQLACDSFHNFVVSEGSKSAFLSDEGEPRLLFQSTQFQAQIKFDHLDKMPCFILDSLTPVRN